MTDGFTIVRRGVASTVANWPLILAQLVEIIVLIALMTGGFLLAMVALGLSLDWDALASFGDPGSDPEAIAEAAAEWFMANLAAVAWLFVAALIVCGVAVFIHAYFRAGVTGVFLGYERRGESWDWREAWSRFEFSRFLDSAVRYGWRVFWVYNVVWGVAGLFLLIPAVLLLGVILLLGENAAAIVVACCGILLVLLVAFLIAIVAGVWAQAAITIGIADDRGAVAASSAAGDFIRARLGAVVIIELVFLGVSIGLSSVASTMGLAFDAAGMLPGGALAALPLRLGFTFVTSVANSILGLWLASSWAILVLDGAPSSSQGGKLAP